ncbi:MAG: hypothetical protein EBR32_00440 [Bacteroidetes bacterium]|nr:hypothetical protein [Bacteroidota bacterium]
MLVVYAISIPFVISGYLFGLKKLKIYLLTTRTILIWLTIVTSLYILALSFYKINVLSEEIAGILMAVFYGIVSGIILGKFHSQISFKRTTGYPLYIYREFLVDGTPVVVGSTLMLAGLFRIFWDLNLLITPIQLYSGVSLLALGLLFYTLSLVPNLKTQCILIIDEAITWNRVTSYEWTNDHEVVLHLDKPSQATSSRSFIRVQVNEGNRVKVERILASKIEAKYIVSEEKSDENESKEESR